MRIIELHFASDGDPILMDAEQIKSAFPSKDPKQPGIVVNLGGDDYFIVAESIKEVELAWKSESRQ